MLAQSKKEVRSYLPDIAGLKDSKILIVDDAEFSRTMIENIFRSNGFSKIAMAVDGRDAVEKTLSFKPDLVILDLMMPNVDGFEYCRIIRQNQDFQGMPIIVQSAVNDPKKASNVFQAGASDFITKPVNAEEIMARSLIHLDRKRLIDEMMVYRNRVEAELGAARDMQLSLLPTDEFVKELSEKHDVDMASFFRPSSEMGGDIWGLREISGSEIAIYTIDFTGHGVSAALNTFRVHTILKESKSFFLSPELFLSKLNRTLHEMLPRGQFATMFYGVVNTDKDTLTYSAAAAPSPILVSGDKFKVIDASGVPLGIKATSSYNTYEVSFKKGDTLVLYSDALIETQDKNGEFISEEKIAEVMMQNDGMFAQFKLDRLLDLFNKNYLLNQTDDLTINICQRV